MPFQHVTGGPTHDNLFVAGAGAEASQTAPKRKKKKKHPLVPDQGTVAPQVHAGGHLQQPLVQYALPQMQPLGASGDPFPVQGQQMQYQYDMQGQQFHGMCAPTPVAASTQPSVTTPQVSSVIGGKKPGK